MRIQLLSIAAAVALALSGVAQAQTSTTPGARADGTRDAKPKVDRKARKAEEDKIEADYKADKAKCGSMKGNEKDVCVKEAKAAQKKAITIAAQITASSIGLLNVKEPIRNSGPYRKLSG